MINDPPPRALADGDAESGRQRAPSEGMAVGCKREIPTVIDSPAIARVNAMLALVSCSLLLVGCAADGSNPRKSESTEHGYCQGNTCTGLCQDEVQQFARTTLGSDARTVFFDWDEPGGGLGMSGGTVYFTTEACTTGKYQLEFLGNPQTCSNTYYGRLPNYVGKLLVVPRGCPGKR